MFTPPGRALLKERKQFVIRIQNLRAVGVGRFLKSRANLCFETLTHSCTRRKYIMLHSSSSLTRMLEVCVYGREGVCGFYYSIMFNHVTYLIFTILCSMVEVKERKTSRRREKNDACSFFSPAAHVKPFLDFHIAHESMHACT